MSDTPTPNNDYKKPNITRSFTIRLSKEDMDALQDAIPWGIRNNLFIYLTRQIALLMQNPDFRIELIRKVLENTVTEEDVRRIMALKVQQEESEKKNED